MLEDQNLAGSGKSPASVTDEHPIFSTAQRVLCALGAAIAFLMMWALYTRLAWAVPMNSDHAAALLQADDFVRGNYLLRGWIAGNMSIYMTELPFYVVGLRVAGFTPSLLRIVPALQFTILLALSMWLVYRETPPRTRRLALIVTFFLLALPWGFTTRLLLVSFKHIGTIVMVLAAFLILTLVDEYPRRAWLYPLFEGFLTFAIMDDELALYIGALPIVLVLAANAALEGSRIGRQKIVLAALAVVSAPLGLLLDHLIVQLGGFVAYAPKPVVAPAPAILGNASLAFRGLLLLFGADPFDRFGILRPLPYALAALVHVFGIILVAIGTWRALRRMTKGGLSDNPVTPILVLAIVIDVACFVVSDRPVEIGSARYLTPVLVFGTLLAGIEAPRLISTRWLRSLTAAVAAVYVATFAPQLFLPRANQHELAVVKWLEQHQLTQGYGDFWAAGIFTAESGGAVEIRQVMATDTGYRPRPWMVNQNWFTSPRRDGSFNFLVLGKSNIDNVNEESARKFFGDPKNEYQVAGYKVLVWDKSLPVR
jgi:hypothetical protein